MSISEIVEEHSLPIQELDDWYRKHASDTISAQIVRAGIWLDKNDHRNLGRAFKEAANRSEGFEGSNCIEPKSIDSGSLMLGLGKMLSILSKETKSY